MLAKSLSRRPLIKLKSVVARAECWWYLPVSYRIEDLVRLIKTDVGELSSAHAELKLDTLRQQVKSICNRPVVEPEGAEGARVGAILSVVDLSPVGGSLDLRSRVF